MTVDPETSADAGSTASIRPLDDAAMTSARERLDRLTKPPGSLGRLEILATQIAGIRGTVVTSIVRPAVLVFAGDHGVTRQGVSPYPAEVTRQMVLNFVAGGAAINVLARAVGAELVVVDVGVAGRRFEPGVDGSDARLLDRRVASGTRDFSVEPAMSAAEVGAAIAAGRDVIADLAGGGVDLVAVGEMGIGNTTSASAIVAALTNRRAADVTGPGTGLDASGIARKAATIDAALARHRPAADRPLEVLRTLGGLEIAALVGAILEAAERGLILVLDGFITGAAALVASRLEPLVANRLIASHRSAEPGHRVVLEALRLDPLLDLGLRLGEGTGAALAIPIVVASVRLLGEMATFEDAGVSGRD